MALRSGTARSGQHGGVLAERDLVQNSRAPSTHRLIYAQAAADADADAGSDACSDAGSDADAEGKLNVEEADSPRLKNHDLNAIDAAPVRWRGVVVW